MKSQAPNPKPARKLQIPSSKLQRSSKYQAANNGCPSGRSIAYSDDCAEEFRIREDSWHPFDGGTDNALRRSSCSIRKKIPRDPANDRLIGQLVGCGTSIGANHCEANERVSKKDFKNTIGRCVKEAKETKYFLRLMAVAEPKLASEARVLYRESKELHLIFATMFRQ